MTKRSDFPSAESVRARLLNLARARDEDYNLVLVRYALERFLYRLTLSSYSREFVLKGALLFQLWSDTPHRATKDLDMLARGNVSMESLRSKITAICGIRVAEDAIEFDLSNLQLSEIREETSYGGIRAKFIARLGSANLHLQLDFGIGDVVTPPAVEMEYPTLLNTDRPKILAYPRETVVAEKLEAIVDLGMANSRMKDYFDLWFIATTFDDDPEITGLAVKRTFVQRGKSIPDTLPPGLSDAFTDNPAKLELWSAFMHSNVGWSLSLNEVVSVVRETAMRLFEVAGSIDEGR